MTKKILRRDALRYGFGAATGFWITSGLANARVLSPNDKLNIAVIGIGGQGGYSLNNITSENCVALCDVDDERAGKAYDKFPGAKKFYDFRKLFDTMDKEIDAAIVCTPDHTHANIAMTAMRLGKHCYCEKPMAHDVTQVRMMTEIAKEKKLATQLGAQRHAKSNMRRIVEIIQSGAIGDVTEVYSRIGGNRGMPAMPTQFPPVPKHLKWDLWLGPADDRKYSPDYCPYNWRFWWDFGTGETGNWGCHILDIPFWALDLGHPIKVSGKGPEVDPQRTPKEMFTTLHYPARGNKPPVKLHWSHTQKALPVFTENNIPNSGNTLFVGSKGFLLCDFDKRKLYPEDKFENFVEPPETIPASPGFHKEWINMCKGGPAATCNFDYTGPMTESVLLANVAYRVGGEFDWDPKTMRAQGRDDVDIFVRPKYRKGWEL